MKDHKNEKAVKCGNCDDAKKQSSDATTAKFDESAIPPGKVFKDSVNIYDDEARVAFEYLKRAATKIVAEEDAVNEKIEESKSRQAVAKAARRKSLFYLILSAFITLCCCGIVFWKNPDDPRLIAIAFAPLIFVIVNSIFMCSHSRKVKAEVAEQSKLSVEFSGIRRDYAINKLGVAYVPVASAVPFESKSFLLDDTGTAAGQEFNLYQLNAPDELKATLTEIENVENAVPFVEAGTQAEEVMTDRMSASIESVKLHDYMGTLDRSLRSASYLLNDLKKTSVKLPIVNPRSEYASFLRDYCAEDMHGYPVIDVFGDCKYGDELERFEELNRTRRQMADENAKMEKLLQDFIVNVSDYVQLMSRAKLTSVGKLVDFSNGLLLNTFKASYNHYSSNLESDEIKRMQEEDFDFKSGGGDYQPLALSPSSRMRYDVIAGNWVSEDGGRTSFPFGVHQIQEEVLTPLVQNLLAETRIDRLKIYNDIMDQKRDYLNQWHRDTDDFYGRGRAESSEIITQMQATLAEFNAAVSQYKAYEDTEKSMKSSDGGDLDAIEIKASGTGTAFSIAYCEEQTKQIRQQQDEFNDYIARLNEDIDRRATGFAYTKYYDASLRDGHAKDVAMSVLAMDKFSERQKMLLGANSYIASRTKLPPEPVVEESVYQALGVNLNQVVEETLKSLGGDSAPEPSAVTDETCAAASEAGNGPEPGSVNESAEKVVAEEGAASADESMSEAACSHDKPEMDSNVGHETDDSSVNSEEAVPSTAPVAKDGGKEQDAGAANGSLRPGLKLPPKKVLRLAKKSSQKQEPVQRIDSNPPPGKGPGAGKSDDAALTEDISKGDSHE